MKLMAGFVLLFAALLLASCGGDGDPGDARSPTVSTDGQDDDTDDGDPGGSNETGTEEDLRLAATAAFEALLHAEYQQYFLGLSRECREEFGYASVESRLVERRTRATRLGGIDLSAVSVTGVTIENFRGGSADVTLTITGTGGGEFQEVLARPWIAEEGRWRMADCSDVRAGQGFREGYGRDRDDPIPFGGIAGLLPWFVVVTFLDDDAEDLVLETPGNEPATAGQQYFALQLSITYNGAEPAVILGDELAFAMVSGSTVYGDDAGCGEIVAALDLSAEYEPGVDAAPGLFCREVDEDDVDDLLLRMTHLATGEEYWFALSR